MNTDNTNSSVQPEIDHKDTQIAGSKLPWHPPTHKSIRQGQVANGTNPTGSSETTTMQVGTMYTKNTALS